MTENAVVLVVFFSLLLQFGNETKFDAPCLDCLTSLAASSTSGCRASECPQFAKCSKRTPFIEASLEPRLLCQTNQSATFAWNHTMEGTFYYFINYSMENRHQLSAFTNCQHLTLSELKPNETYSIRLYAISSKTGSVLEGRNVAQTTLVRSRKKVTLTKPKYELKLTSEGRYTATITWISDLSCVYYIMWYEVRESRDFKELKIDLRTSGKTEINLTKLEFGRTYNVSLESESGYSSRKITIPGCLETFSNLTKCPPHRPKNLTVLQYSVDPNEAGPILQPGKTNLKITWSKPHLVPDYYNLSFVNGSTMNHKTTRHFNVTGHSDYYLLQDIILHNFYIAKLVAYSSGGRSAETYVRKEVPKLIEKEIIRGRTTVAPWIWIGSFLSLALLFAFIFTTIVKNFSKYCFAGKKQNDNSDTVRYVSTKPIDVKWELAESKLRVDVVIGCGAFGFVQKGVYSAEPNQKIPVAVKTLKAKPTAEQVAQFFAEIDIMKSVPRHAHIVRLMGVVSKNRPTNPLMIVEYCAKGDLQTFLRKMAAILSERCRKSFDTEQNGEEFFNQSYEFQDVLEAKDLLSFARQITLGMEFLGTLKIVHRDLAARNVLITDTNILKISDFGLSRDIYTDNIYKKTTSGKLPIRWMALESLTHQIYTSESDVWSFGVLLWEIVTLGSNPYPTVATEHLLDLLKSGYRMDRPLNCSPQLYDVMLSCWEATSALRPSFKELREVFDKLLESEMQYVNLEGVAGLERSNGIKPTNRYICSFLMPK